MMRMEWTAWTMKDDHISPSSHILPVEENRTIFVFLLLSCCHGVPLEIIPEQFKSLSYTWFQSQGIFRNHFKLNVFCMNLNVSLKIQAVTSYYFDIIVLQRVFLNTWSPNRMYCTWCSINAFQTPNGTVLMGLKKTLGKSSQLWKN